MADHVFRQVVREYHWANRKIRGYLFRVVLTTLWWNFFNGRELIASLWRIFLKLNGKNENKGARKHIDFLLNVDVIRNISYPVSKRVCKFKKILRPKGSRYSRWIRGTLFRQYNKLIGPYSWIEEKIYGESRENGKNVLLRFAEVELKWFLTTRRRRHSRRTSANGMWVFFPRPSVRVSFITDYSWSALIVPWWIKQIAETICLGRFPLREHLGTPLRLSHDSEYARKFMKWSPISEASDLRISVTLNMITEQSHSGFRKLLLHKIKRPFLDLKDKTCYNNCRISMPHCNLYGAQAYKDNGSYR